MLTNSNPMKIELLGRLVSDWEETKRGVYFHNNIAINKYGLTYFIRLITEADNAKFLKGQKVILKGNIMDIYCCKDNPRITVFVEVIELD